jgi:predicted RNA-binding Zn ribbon-like protein
MPAPFQLFASHPALDFVNTLDNRFVASGPNELLASYTDLLAFIEQSEVLSRRHVGALRNNSESAQAKALIHALELRESLACVFYEIAIKGKPSRESLKRIEEYSLEAQDHRHLVWTRSSTGDETFNRALWGWKSSENSALLPIWTIALAAAELLTSTAVSHIHECRSPTCRWLFLDTSKNHSRCWCDMTICGNRMKARRFQAAKVRIDKK